MSKRHERLESLLLEKIARIVQTDLNDPRLGFITITSVKVARDLRSANVEFSAIGTDGEEVSPQRIKMFEDVLNQGAPEVQRSLINQIDIRYMPKLRFSYSDRLRHAIEMSSLIRQARATDLRIEDEEQTIEDDTKELS